MPSRFQVITPVTTASVAAGAALAFSVAISASIVDIMQMIATISTGTGGSRLEIYDSAASATTAATANTDVISFNTHRVYRTDTVTGTITDPIDAPAVGTAVAGYVLFIEPYQDLDNGSNLHVVVYNRDTVSKTYTITGLTVEAPLYDAIGNMSLRASIGLFGVSPPSRPAAYTVTNATPTRTIDISTVDVVALANLVAQIIADLQSYGNLQ